MTIWIIEDDATHARAAWQEIKNLIIEMDALARRHKRGESGAVSQTRLFWDQSMSWKPKLKSLDDEFVPVEASGELPDIVVLDLFLEGELVAPTLLKNLRDWEWNERRQPRNFSHVILWSNYPGRRDALNFMRTASRDKHVVAMETKDAKTLRVNIAHCWQSREEEQYP